MTGWFLPAAVLMMSDDIWGLNGSVGCFFNARVRWVTAVAWVGAKLCANSGTGKHQHVTLFKWLSRL